MKLTKIYLFLLSPLPSQDGWGGGGGLLQLLFPPTFFTAKIFENVFLRYKEGICTKGGEIDRIGNPSEKAKAARGKMVAKLQNV